MTIYEKMHALVTYYATTVEPFITEMKAKADTMTAQEKSDVVDDIDCYMRPLENGQDDLYSLGSTLAEYAVIREFYDRVLYDILDKVDSIKTYYFINND